MEPKNGGWEDDFPVKIFVMLGFQWIFRGVTEVISSRNKWIYSFALSITDIWRIISQDLQVVSISNPHA